MQMTRHIHVSGVVQGVGFRPFVYGLATRLHLRGWVCNTSAGVDILVQGDEQHIGTFIESLSAQAPPLARIDQVSVWEEVAEDYPDFRIRESERVEGAFQPVSPDVALCVDCERELLDPTDRRYLYSFINCTHCGPRFTIIKDLPYDRPSTTMADFAMCDACRAEYEDPTNRRFHAQPVACPNCGPFVQLRESSAHPSTVVHIDMRWSAVVKARKLLREGKVVAIKGLGGFHLACDATNEIAVAELRRRKGRGGKPFAVMFADMKTVNQYCFTDQAELSLLDGREKPIVILDRKATNGIAPSVAPGMDTLGVMLPYTPLHHLLLNQSDPIMNRELVPPALVMTSGNFQ
jgi:hydrogenase maturation protein HypF